MNCVVPPQAIELAHKLNAITPPSIDCFFFSNSGAEAVEGAVKLARQTTGRNNIIVMNGSYHGRTAVENYYDFVFLFCFFFFVS